MSRFKALAPGLGIAVLMVVGIACGAGNTPASEDPGTAVGPPGAKPTGQAQAAEVVEREVTDRQQLIRVVLVWALVDKNLPDHGLLPDPTNVLMSLDGLSADELPTLPGVTLSALTEGELQNKADAEGSLLRLSLENLVIAGDTAEIRVSNWWIRSSTETRQFLSGGFCELQLRKTGGQWSIVNSVCALA